VTLDAIAAGESGGESFSDRHQGAEDRAEVRLRRDPLSPFQRPRRRHSA
jgi:hypothetical protein